MPSFTSPYLAGCTWRAYRLLLPQKQLLLCSCTTLLPPGWPHHMPAGQSLKLRWKRPHGRRVCFVPAWRAYWGLGRDC